TGRASVMISNYDYNSPGQKDDLRLPRVNLNKVDSAFLSFDVAAATSTPLNTASNTWDTLEVLASTDCGETYTSLYKKYGNSLITKLVETAAFIPGPNEWRKDSVNLIDYIGTTGLLLAFRNTNGYENNIYLDNINLRTVTINPNLKTRHFLVTPNPTTGIFAVQFYAQPTELKAIQVFNIAGQKIKEIAVNGQPGNYYSVNINAYAAGIYVVRAVFTDKVLIKKIIKR
ncbi:MAG: T9SS type A sorting domain-containing protein, partial [Mucilaginibacter sp.]